jgi:hypothetical protein
VHRAKGDGGEFLGQSNFYRSGAILRAYSPIQQAMEFATSRYFGAKHFGFYLRETNKQWVVLFQIGVQPPIHGTYEVTHALPCLETLGSSKMQDLFLVDHSK